MNIILLSGTPRYEASFYPEGKRRGKFRGSYPFDYAPQQGSGQAPEPPAYDVLLSSSQ